MSGLFSPPSIYLFNFGEKQKEKFPKPLSLFIFLLLTSTFLSWNEELTAKKEHSTLNRGSPWAKVLLRCQCARFFLWMHPATFVYAVYSSVVFSSLPLTTLDETADLKSSIYSYFWSGLPNLKYCLQGGSNPAAVREQEHTAEKAITRARC